MEKYRVIIIRNAKSYDFGGGERFPVSLGEVLQKNNLYPILITRHQKLLDFALSHSIPTIKGWWWPNQNWSGKRAVLFPVYLIWQVVLFFWYLQLFIKIKPYAIHIQSKDDFIAATWAGKILRLNVIWTDHADLKHIWKNISIWYKNPVGKLVHRSARFANVITVISNSELSLVSANLKKDDAIKNKLKIIFNGVNDVAAKYITKTSKNFTYCVTSRLVTDKGINEVIDAFNNLTKKYPKDKLLLVGDGPEAKKFINKAKINTNIKFTGYQDDPLKYVAECDVFIHPTYHEGFSLSLLEASMLSKPIIATSVGGNVELIKDYKTGLLVKVKDVNSLQEAMELLRNDKALRNKLSNSAREQYIKRFQFDLTVKKEFIPLYKKVSHEN